MNATGFESQKAITIALIIIIVSARLWQLFNSFYKWTTHEVRYNLFLFYDTAQM